ncbi:MAG: SRPBCC family protein [Phycisphaerae bacterium]|nr:SRPBCC family protein [Phycisphaerae bacterium]
MAITVSRKIRVRRPVGEVFALWADFENFPRFMSHIAAATPVRDGVTHWVLKGPPGITLEWDAQTTEMTFARRIAWRTLSGHVEHTGEVLFNDLGGETEMTVTMTYETPYGTLGDLAGKLLLDPQSQLETDLENFKRFCEKTAPLRRTG